MKIKTTKRQQLTLCQRHWFAKIVFSSHSIKTTDNGSVLLWPDSTWTGDLWGLPVIPGNNDIGSFHITLMLCWIGISEDWRPSKNLTLYEVLQVIPILLTYAIPQVMNFRLAVQWAFTWTLLFRWFWYMSKKQAFKSPSRTLHCYKIISDF